MTVAIEPLNKEKHSGLKLKRDISIELVKDKSIVPLTAVEFGQAGAQMPVMFVKGPNDEYRAIGVTGLEDGENLLFNEEGINSSYVPFEIQRLPFSLAKNPEDERYILCIDSNSDLINENDGEAIIKDDGSLGERAEQMNKFVFDFVQHDRITQEMLKHLDELELFAPAQVAITMGENKRVLNGLFRIDDKKLRDLTDEQVLDLHKRNYFAAIYSHLHSLSQIQRLIELKTKKNASK